MANPQVPVGSLVRMKQAVGGYSEARTGIVVEAGHHPRLYKVRSHGCRGSTAIMRDEFVVKAAQHDGAFVSMRDTMPYGRWTTAEGRELLFNRDYKPIWSRTPGQPAVPNDPTEWIKKAEQAWFFTDGDPPWSQRKTLHRCLQILRDWKAPLPIADRLLPLPI